MFFKRKQPIIPDIPFDPETQKPVIRCSICNGEQIAGFKDKKTGKFTEVLLVRTPEDLERFRKQYGLDHVPKEY